MYVFQCLCVHKEREQRGIGMSICAICDLPCGLNFMIKADQIFKRCWPSFLKKYIFSSSITAHLKVQEYVAYPSFLNERSTYVQ